MRERIGHSCDFPRERRESVLHCEIAIEQRARCALSCPFRRVGVAALIEHLLMRKSTADCWARDPNWTAVAPPWRCIRFCIFLGFPGVDLSGSRSPWVLWPELVRPIERPSKPLKNVSGGHSLGDFRSFLALTQNTV